MDPLTPIHSMWTNNQLVVEVLTRTLAILYVDGRPL
jgi:hypothetical protein